MRFIRNWAVATFILTFLVIIAGGVVRTTQSGMGCPDWPRCFGKWIPPTSASELPADYEKYLRKQDIDHSFNAVHTWIEYVNRLLGALLGVFAVIQVASMIGKRRQLKQPYNFSLLFLLVVVLTGLFGAIVVKLNLAHLSITVHLLFAVILILAQLALLLSLRAKMNTITVDAATKKALVAFLLILFVQCSLGTVVRMHVDDVSKELDYTNREAWLDNSPVAFLVHRSFSWAVLLLSLYMAWKNRNHAMLKSSFFILSGIILLIMATGIILYEAGMPAAAQPTHLLLATIAITQGFSILLRAGKGSSR